MTWCFLCSRGRAAHDASSAGWSARSADGAGACMHCSRGQSRSATATGYSNTGVCRCRKARRKRTARKSCANTGAGAHATHRYRAARSTRCRSEHGRRRARNAPTNPAPRAKPPPTPRRPTSTWIAGPAEHDPAGPVPTRRRSPTDRFLQQCCARFSAPERHTFLNWDDRMGFSRED
ncbi:hypothetical protein DMP08_09110 [Paraeggerthella hongkongensis]|uniref:Uncharacterized protein n=1 Tax=Paraeggerthella hongkongensis TaxID=230658 RepID=A0A3N0B4L8_9ACTN|nr:hypothetical protein DMP08_09110 [Paraeggerthella hongkongensis]